MAEDVEVMSVSGDADADDTVTPSHVTPSHTVVRHALSTSSDISSSNSASQSNQNAVSNGMYIIYIYIFGNNILSKNKVVVFVIRIVIINMYEIKVFLSNIST